MIDPNNETSIKKQITEWRSYLYKRQAIHSVDIDELEDHLREQMRTLQEGGLDSVKNFGVWPNPE